MISDLLVAPGKGVHTVHTGANKRNKLHQALYGKVGRAAEKTWRESLENQFSASQICLLGLASDCGGGIHRGANWGPLFLREQLYNSPTLRLNERFLDLGDIKVVPHILHDKYLSKETIQSVRESIYDSKENQHPVSPISISETISEQIFSQKKKLLSIGGDHSMSYGPCKEFLLSAQKNNKKAAIIHFDAHTDLLEKRMGIDLCFASWAYHMIPLLPSPECLIQLGIRSSGKDKKYWESQLGVKQFWANEILSSPQNSIHSQVFEILKKNQIDELYISFDIDALDSSVAGATGTPEPGGLFLHHCIPLIQELSKNYKIGAADLMEVAPFINYGEDNKESTLMAGALLLETFIESLSK